MVGRKPMAKKEKRTFLQFSLYPIEKQIIAEITKALNVKKSNFILNLLHQSPEFIEAAMRHNIDIKILKASKKVRGNNAQRKKACNYRKAIIADMSCYLCAYANEKTPKSNDLLCGLHKFPWREDHVCDDFEISRSFKK